MEGNPVNTFVYAILIASALIVLSKRGFNWGIAISRNKALFLIYFFLAISAFWSELPFVSLKRLIKDFGGVPVALIILTELDPITAFRTIFVRVSYLLFPLSIVFIKYFCTGRLCFDLHSSFFAVQKGGATAENRNYSR